VAYTDLIAYFGAERGGAPTEDAGRVIVFEGQHIGTGFDGEPLAVPTEVVETLTWSEFIAR
jgi:hypothetical protein